jgi:hypothetical protein
MSSPTEFDCQIQALTREPSSQGALMLELLYRQAVEQGQQEYFCSAIVRALSSTQRSTLLDAWGYRLDILPLEKPAQTAQTIQYGGVRLWGVALSISIMLGLIWSIFSGGRPPLPFPNQAAPLFWLGWAPVTALSIMGFIAAVTHAREQIRTFGTAAAAIVALSFLSGWMAWGRKDAATYLIAFHLPLLAWIAVGAAATVRIQNRPIRTQHFVGYA